MEVITNIRMSNKVVLFNSCSSLVTEMVSINRPNSCIIVSCKGEKKLNREKLTAGVTTEAAEEISNDNVARAKI